MTVLIHLWLFFLLYKTMNERNSRSLFWHYFSQIDDLLCGHSAVDPSVLLHPCELRKTTMILEILHIFQVNLGDELPSNICKKNDITIKVRTSISTIPQMMTSINSSSSESLTFYLQKHTKEERLRLQMSIVRNILLAPFVQWYQIQNMDWILEQLIKHNAIK